MHHDRRRCRSCPASCRGPSPACPRLDLRQRPLGARQCAPESADMARRGPRPAGAPRATLWQRLPARHIAMAAAFVHPLTCRPAGVRRIFRQRTVCRGELQHPLRRGAGGLVWRRLGTRGGVEARRALAQQSVGARRIDALGRAGGDHHAIIARDPAWTGRHLGRRLLRAVARLRQA
jgi:hypothetical protein